MEIINENKAFFITTVPESPKHQKNTKEYLKLKRHVSMTFWGQINVTLFCLI